MNKHQRQDDETINLMMERTKRGEELSWGEILSVAELHPEVTEEHYEQTYDEGDGDLLPRW